MNKQCQSCGMPLHTTKAGDCRGTESDGSKSEVYCLNCYINGIFTQPDITLSEMKVFVDNQLIEAGWIKPMRWVAKKQLPSLGRWSRK